MCKFVSVSFLIKTEAISTFNAIAIWTDVYIFMCVFFLIKTKAISIFYASEIWTDVYNFICFLSYTIAIYPFHVIGRWWMCIFLSTFSY